MPIETSISEEELLKLVRHFKSKDYPLDPVVCHFCYFRDIGLCKGYKPQQPSETELVPDEELEKLLNRREQLLMELDAIEETIKKKIGNKQIIWKGKLFGKVEYTGYSYDNPTLVRLIKEKGYRAIDFFQVKPHRIKDLELLLGTDIEKARVPEKKRRFVFGADPFKYYQREDNGL